MVWQQRVMTSLQGRAILPRGLAVSMNGIGVRRIHHVETHWHLCEVKQEDLM